MLHSTILSRVEAQNSDPSTCPEAVREAFEKGIQGVELFIDGDANGLESAGRGVNAAAGAAGGRGAAMILEVE